MALLACAALLMAAGPAEAASAPRRERIILSYNNADRPLWTAEDLLPYVAYLKPDGSPQGWFFDTFLLLGLNAASGHGLCPGFGGPSTREDWTWYLEQRLFGPDHHLAALDRAVGLAQQRLGDRTHRVRVIIAIPYPDPRQTQFGDLEGEPISFATSALRARAVQWYLSQVTSRWTRAHFQHLVLGGFYWIHEEVPTEDEELLPQVAALCRKQLLPLYWIPWFGAQGAGDWARYGFAVALQQPNYFFYDVPPERLKEAAEFARAHGMGVELELDQRILTSPDHRARYRRYLNAGVEFGFQDNPLLAWYEDSALLLSSRSPDPEVRAFYDDTYAFAMGNYRVP
jgi:hypothetical protein